MKCCALTVNNQLGLHARAAARFVHAASAFDARVRVARDSRETDGKSIMGLLLLSAARGTVITITADGRDEAAALDALCRLVERGFDEAAVDASQDGPFDNAQDKPFDDAQDKPFDRAQDKPFDRAQDKQPCD
jgi:phosphotransferase system HPr (HPr) family protein